MRLSRDLVASLLPIYPELEPEARAEVQQSVQEFMAAELTLAPWHLRSGLFVLGLACALHCRLCLLGRPLGAVPPERRAAVLARWERLAGNLGRSFLRAVRGMVVLAFYDHPLVLARLGAPDPARRQAERRAYRGRRLQERHA
ncbi:MAG: hypothetical protein HY342_06710 [Candidatus Lambdaproteobacteria bacterium]|nr:hypothetical protein [Candidatus Lambdaproteobacteria bacterium]